MYRVGDIELFLRVLDLGSISAAARSLDLSVAVASQRLKRLENDLGVRLLHRTTRRLHPTAEGAALAEQGRGLIEELDALAGALRRAGTEISGTLRVTTASSFGRQYLSPLLPEFMARHPGLRMSIHLEDRVVDLVSAGFDVAVRIGAMPDSSLVARRLAGNRRLLCASPDYLRRHGEPRTPQELARHQCLVLVGTQGRQDLWPLRDAAGNDVSVRVNGRIEANTGELLSDAALGGLGIAMHSYWHVCELLRAGQLRQVLTDYVVPETGIYAVMPQRTLMPARVRALIDFLTEKFGDVPPWDRPRS